MKLYYLFLLFALFILSSCEPMYRLYFENETETNITIILDGTFLRHPERFSAYPGEMIHGDTTSYIVTQEPYGQKPCKVTLRPKEYIVIESLIGRHPSENNLVYPVIIGQDTILIKRKEILAKIIEREKRNFYYSFK